MPHDDGEGFVVVVAIVLVFLLLVWYWRQPESGGGEQPCEHPCVEVTW